MYSAMAPFGMMRRSWPSQECRWASTNPGITMVLEASITCACGGALSWPPRATIFLPSISTSPLAKLPTFESMLTTVPPLSRIGRAPGRRRAPGAVQGAGVVRGRWALGGRHFTEDERSSGDGGGRREHLPARQPIVPGIFRSDLAS